MRGESRDGLREGGGELERRVPGKESKGEITLDPKVRERKSESDEKERKSLPVFVIMVPVHWFLLPEENLVALTIAWKRKCESPGNTTITINPLLIPNMPRSPHDFAKVSVIILL